MFRYLECSHILDITGSDDSKAEIEEFLERPEYFVELYTKQKIVVLLKYMKLLKGKQSTGMTLYNSFYLHRISISIIKRTIVVAQLPAVSQSIIPCLRWQ